MTEDIKDTDQTHPSQDEYEVGMDLFPFFHKLMLQEMFERIDREADGEVYVSEVLDFLSSMADDLDQGNNNDARAVQGYLTKLTAE